MTVKYIWRYPVKTMAGEELQRAVIGPLGIGGDRLVHVEDARGQVVTSRSHPRFLGHKAVSDARGAITVDVRAWQSPEVDAEVEDIAGKGARLVSYEGPGVLGWPSCEPRSTDGRRSMVRAHARAGNQPP